MLWWGICECWCKWYTTVCLDAWHLALVWEVGESSKGAVENIVIWVLTSWWFWCRYTDTGEVPHKVLFQTRNLMRTALSPDQTKLVMSTSSGYIMVVHDFDVNTIADDLNGFKVTTLVIVCVHCYHWCYYKLHCILEWQWSVCYWMPCVDLAVLWSFMLYILFQ